MNPGRKPDYDTLSKLADIYKVSVDYLLGRSTDERLTAEQDKQATAMGKKIEQLISKLSEEEQKSLGTVRNVCTVSTKKE